LTDENDIIRCFESMILLTLVLGLAPESPAAAEAVPPPVLLRAFFPRPADPVVVAVLEPLASKYAAVLAAGAYTRPLLRLTLIKPFVWDTLVGLQGFSEEIRLRLIWKVDVCKPLFGGGGGGDDDRAPRRLVAQSGQPPRARRRCRRWGLVNIARRVIRRISYPRLFSLRYPMTCSSNICQALAAGSKSRRVEGGAGVASSSDDDDSDGWDDDYDLDSD